MSLLDLARCNPAERRRLLEAFYGDVYLPAFPDPNLREEWGLWFDLMESAPPPPAPAITVLLRMGGDGRPVGGIVAELYRRSRTGLITYVAVSQAARRRGVGRSLVEAALAWIAETAGFRPVVLAETELLAPGLAPSERQGVRTRHLILSRLGAAAADFDYFMPPLEPGKDVHRLLLLAFAQTLPPSGTVPAAAIAAFLAELAAALGADLAAHRETEAMMRRLDSRDEISFLPLGDRASGDN
ncbi:MAG TPA: GNAT family N-acetyltransferase [Allosphingosinicella sp.]